LLQQSGLFTSEDAEFDIKNISSGRYVIIWTGVETDQTKNVYTALLDNDLNWLTSPIRVNSDATGNQYKPSLQVKGDTAYIAWLDERSGTRQVYFRRFAVDNIKVTGIEPSVAQEFSLHQNFPNPFSPSTTISFTIPSRSFVTLKIFDALGKEVSTLVSGDLDMGQHSYQWNAEGLRSGVYLCRLQAGSYVATQKLSLLR
jgi:hypothetical protein